MSAQLTQVELAVPCEPSAKSRRRGARRSARLTRAVREEAQPYRVVAVDDRPNSEEQHSPASPLRFIDLFCGIGGFRIAFERAGCECVFSCDWDKFAQDTYELNFGERPHGDIYSVPDNAIPPHEILCAGFPCQPFSIAGVSKKQSLGRKHGFEDKEQGNLFFPISDILDFHQPPPRAAESTQPHANSGMPSPLK